MRGGREIFEPTVTAQNHWNVDMSLTDMLLNASPIAVLICCVGRPAIRYFILLIGLLIALWGITESSERVKAYAALTNALTGYRIPVKRITPQVRADL